jgi:hypothetical protein
VVLHTLKNKKFLRDFDNQQTLMNKAFSVYCENNFGVTQTMGGELAAPCHLPPTPCPHLPPKHLTNCIFYIKMFPV